MVAEAAITAKVYDGTTAVADADIAVAVKSSDLVDSANDVITITAKGANIFVVGDVHAVIAVCQHRIVIVRRNCDVGVFLGAVIVVGVSG